VTCSSLGYPSTACVLALVHMTYNRNRFSREETGGRKRWERRRRDVAVPLNDRPV
jgi:hypothetical protein